MSSIEMTIDGISFGKLSVQGMKEKDFVAEYMHEKHADIWPGPDKETRLKEAYARITKASPAKPSVAEPPVIDTLQK